ncbi:DUF2510 domain-containing protein [Streptomyces palmae]|uniref:DUF2510 domain-containing protein n=1 Tax=Streptomyces palmae TaxID=1701085 RepID=A0A4Z0H7I3_9ACTN|nr:DUF2510 domain-containing protein [Streptomyces palmae]TGB10336.1 DUF2510 domain-containing protein [Streptomyces palmae]
MTTPPGWYPDPTHPGPGPAPERWWDGAGWTEHRRTPAVHDAATLNGAPLTPPAAGAPGAPGIPGAPVAPGYPPAAPGYAPVPGYPPGPAGPPRGRGPKIAAVVVAGAVLVAAIVGGVVLLQDGGDDKDGKDDKAVPPSSSAPPSASGGQSDGGSSDAPSSGPTADPSIAEDTLSGITLPVLDGWRGASTQSGASVTTEESYPCPSLPAQNCIPGGAFSFPAIGFKAKSPKGIAKEDIAANAEDSYGTDPRTKKKIYGGINKHQELKSEAVTVAGQQGYLVRWKVDTKKGADGIVQSLVFPSPTKPDVMVLVRFGFDASGTAPTLDDMDEIVKGIRAFGDSEDDGAV